LFQLRPSWPETSRGWRCSQRLPATPASSTAPVPSTIYSIIDFCLNQTRVVITVYLLLQLAKSANDRLKNGRISMPPAFVGWADSRITGSSGICLAPLHCFTTPAIALCICICFTALLFLLGTCFTAPAIALLLWYLFYCFCNCATGSGNCSAALHLLYYFCICLLLLHLLYYFCIRFTTTSAIAILLRHLLCGSGNCATALAFALLLLQCPAWLFYRPTYLQFSLRACNCFTCW
jgi:hypothetical protein